VAVESGGTAVRIAAEDETAEPQKTEGGGEEEILHRKKNPRPSIRVLRALNRGEVIAELEGDPLDLHGKAETVDSWIASHDADKLDMDLDAVEVSVAEVRSLAAVGRKHGLPIDLHLRRREG
jgi:hypothetical protein